MDAGFIYIPQACTQYPMVSCTLAGVAALLVNRAFIHTETNFLLSVMEVSCTLATLSWDIGKQDLLTHFKEFPAVCDQLVDGCRAFVVTEKFFDGSSGGKVVDDCSIGRL